MAKRIKEKQSITAEDVGSLEDVLGLDDERRYACDTCGVEVKKDQRVLDRPSVLWICEKCKASEARAKPQYRISGLNLDQEKEAIAMLDAGRDIAEIMDIFGIARSDIMTLNTKR